MYFIDFCKQNQGKKNSLANKKKIYAIKTEMELRHSNSIFKFRMKISYFSIDSKLLGSYFQKLKKKKSKIFEVCRMNKY